MATSTVANTANATAMGVLLTSPVSDSLHGESTMSYFRGAHVQAAPFQVQLVNDSLQGLTLDMTADGECNPYVFPRVGDYVGRVAIEITAPLLATVSAANIDSDGGTAGNKESKRMLVDDLPHHRAGLQRMTVDDGSSVTFGTKIMLLSDYLDSVQVAGSADDAAYLIHSNTALTFPTAFEQGRDYFPSEDAMARYCRFAPMYLLRTVTLRFSSQDVDVIKPIATLASHCIWNLFNSSGESVHDSADTSVLRAWSSMSERRWMVFLPFWFAAGHSQYLRSRAWSGHEISLAFTFAPLREIIVGSPDHVDALTSIPTNAAAASTFVVRTTSNGRLGAYLSPIGGTFPATSIAASQFSMRIRYERIHAPKHERDLLHNSEGKITFITHRYEKENMQLSNVQLTAANTEVQVDIQPKLSVMGFLFAVQRNSQVVQNKRLSFTGVPSPFYPVDGQIEEAQPLISNIRLEVESEPLFSEGYHHLHRDQMSMYARRDNVPAGLMYRGFGTGSPYDLQKRGAYSFAAISDTKLYLLPNVNACASHVAEGGVAGESARLTIMSYVVNEITWERNMPSKEWL